MNDYVVEWSIDVEDVENPLAAAVEAWDAMRREGSIANAFEVSDHHYMTTHVDLTDGSVGQTVWVPGPTAVGDLAEWMAAHDWDTSEIVAMIRRPHKYADQYSQMISDRAFDAVAKGPEEIETDEEAAR